MGAKQLGPWTMTGGGGYVVNHAPGARNYWFGGWQMQRALTDALILGGELFSQQSATVQGAGATFMTFGGYYVDEFLRLSAALRLRPYHRRRQPGRCLSGTVLDLEGVPAVTGGGGNPLFQARWR
ncbi:MAG: hypothetical protein KGL13_02970 [Gammaproteobacteria bacterium]|nr:hypothetical protein [Gammaproteobacteria bacterium]MDE2345410.1 hypothetical protein [Gammaproteobacteria bacterium]